MKKIIVGQQLEVTPKNWLTLKRLLALEDLVQIQSFLQMKGSKMAQDGTRWHKMALLIADNKTFFFIFSWALIESLVRMKEKGTFWQFLNVFDYATACQNTQHSIVCVT